MITVRDTQLTGQPVTVSTYRPARQCPSPKQTPDGAATIRQHSVMIGFALGRNANCCLHTPQTGAARSELIAQIGRIYPQASYIAPAVTTGHTRITNTADRMPKYRHQRFGV